LNGERSELKNRRLHIYWNEDRQDFSNRDEQGVALSEGSEAEARETINETISETAESVLELIRDNPSMTYAEIAASLGKSRATAHGMTAGLKAKGFIERIGANKNGRWAVTSSFL
jgi:predicted HTH transcriptional regulator